MSNQASVGRTICLVLGVLSVTASLAPLFSEIRAPGEAGVSEMCGAVTNPDDEPGPGCSAALQAHALSAMLPAVAGVAWMLGAVAFSLGPRRTAVAAPTARPMPSGPPPPGQHPGPWQAHQTPWPPGR